MPASLFLFQFMMALFGLAIIIGVVYLIAKLCLKDKRQTLSRLAFFVYCPIVALFTFFFSMTLDMS